MAFIKITEVKKISENLELPTPGQIPENGEMIDEGTEGTDGNDVSASMSEEMYVGHNRTPIEFPKEIEIEEDGTLCTPDGKEIEKPRMEFPDEIEITEDGMIIPGMEQRAAPDLQRISNEGGSSEKNIPGKDAPDTAVTGQAEDKRDAGDTEANKEGNAETVDKGRDSGESKDEHEDTDDKHEDDKEKKDLTEDEINEMQQAAIKEAQERIARGEKLTKQETGNLCEMMMDQYYIRRGYKPLHSPRVTALDQKGHKGIDGVYQKGDKFVICDAKYDTSKQKETQDGLQMSKTWIEKRLDNSVGKEKADEIQDAEEDGRVSHEIYHYDPNPDESGNTYSDIHTVDENGDSNHDEQIVETYRDGEPVESNDGGEDGARSTEG